MPRRVLLLLGVSPFDRTNGAARAMRSVCETIAGHGFEVRAVAPTACVHAEPETHLASIHDDDGRPPREYRFDPPTDGEPGVHRFVRNGVRYALLETGAATHVDWEREHGAAFDRLLDAETDVWRPDVLFTFGGSPDERRRRHAIRERGAAVLFYVQNHHYYDTRAFVGVDHVLTCSAFLAGEYERRIGVRSTPIRPPYLAEDVIAPKRVPKYVTYINPELEKGVIFFARLAASVAERRPGVAFMVVESRGTSRTLAIAAHEAGVDPARLGNVRISPGAPHPKAIFALTRALLVPSIFEEPLGSVVIEAHANGAPVLAFGHGGIPEACNGAGLLFPISRRVRDSWGRDATDEDVAPWADAIIRLHDDEAHYRERSEAALRASRAFTRKATAPALAEVFSGVRRGGAA